MLPAVALQKQTVAQQQSTVLCRCQVPADDRSVDADRGFAEELRCSQYSCNQELTVSGHYVFLSAITIVSTILQFAYNKIKLEIITVIRLSPCVKASRRRNVYCLVWCSWFNHYKHVASLHMRERRRISLHHISMFWLTVTFTSNLGKKRIS